MYKYIYNFWYDFRLIRSVFPDLEVYRRSSPLLPHTYRGCDDILLHLTFPSIGFRAQGKTRPVSWRGKALQPWRCLIPYVGFQICRSELLKRITLLFTKGNIWICNDAPWHLLSEDISRPSPWWPQNYRGRDDIFLHLTFLSMGFWAKGETWHVSWRGSLYNVAAMAVSDPLHPILNADLSLESNFGVPPKVDRKGTIGFCNVNNSTQIT